MKFVQNSDEYIKKDEFKSAYSYQQKAIDDKIGEMKNHIDKIQEVVSLRFGDDLGKNKYDVELETLDTKINGIKNDVSNHEQNLHKELENAIENKFVKINEVNDKTENVNKKLQNIELNIDEAKKKIDSYTGEFKQEVENLKKEGKNKLTIVMQGKKIEKLEQGTEGIKKQLDQKADEINMHIKDIEKKAQEKIQLNEEKLAKDLENMRVGTNEKVQKNEELIKEFDEKANKKIEEINSGLIQKIDDVNNSLKGILEKSKEEFKNNFENRIKELNYENTLSNIKKAEDKLVALEKENEELRKRNEFLESEIQKVMVTTINLEEKFNSSLSKEIDKIAEKKTRAMHSKYEKQLRDRIKLIEKRMKYQVKGGKGIKLLPEANYVEDSYRYTPIEEEDTMWGIKPIDKQGLKRTAGTNGKFKVDIPIEQDEQLLFKPKKNQILGWFNKEE